MANQYRPHSISHPGEVLREKLEELQMGTKEFAVRTGKPEKTISEILHGKSSITPEMAVSPARQNIAALKSDIDNTVGPVS